MNKRALIIVSLLIASLSLEAVAAHTGPHAGPVSQAVTASPEPSETVSPEAEETLSPTPPVSASPVVTPTTPAPGRFAIFRLRVARIFAGKSSVRRGELTRQIAEAIHARLQADLAAGKTEVAAKGLDRYNRESDLLETVIDTIRATTRDPAIAAFLDQVASDKSAQLAALDALQTNSGTGNTTSIANKIIATRAKAIRSLVKVLDNSNLTEEERQAKVTKIMEKYTEKEAKIEEKISRRLAFKAELADSTEDETVLISLEAAEDKVVEESENLTEEERAKLLVAVGKLKEQHSLAVLLKLRERAPEAAQAGIDTAINALITKKLKTLEANAQALEALANDTSISPELREKIIERLKERGSEKVQKEIEKQLEKVKGEVKKREIKRNNSGKTTPKSGTTSQPAASSNPFATPKVATPSPASGSISEQRTAVEVRIREGKLEKSSYLVDRNSILTIKLRNEDDKSYTITLANGATGAVGPKSEVALSSFLFTGTLNFTVTGELGTLSGVLEAK